MEHAASATSPDETPRQHQNLNTLGWTYVGRSYGVDSSPVLVDLPFSSPLNYMAFQYTETGYTSSVTCAQNASSNFTLT